MKYFFFAYIFLVSTSLFSQNTLLDSLNSSYQKALSRKKNDTIVLKIKFEIAWNLRGINPDSSILISDEIQEEIIKNHFKSSKNKLIKQLEDSKKQLSRLDIRYLILLGDNYHALAVCYDIKGAYNTSLENNFNSLRIWNYLSTFDPTRFKIKKSSSYGNIGILFEELGDNKKALFYFDKCLKIKEKLNDKQGVALTYGSIGTVYYSEGNTDKAQNYYQKAADLLLELKDENNASAYIGNLAVVYMDKENYSKAIELFSKGLKIDQKLNKKRGETAKLGNIGFAYLKMKQYQKAEEFLTKALKISSSLNLESMIPDHHLYLSELYENTNREKKALYHYKKYFTYLEGIKNDEVIRTQTKLITEFEYEKKQEIQKKEQEKKQALLLAEKNKQIYINLLLIAVILIIIIIVSFIINSSKKQKKQVELLAAKRQLEIEYKLLRAQMNPHFIFNVLNSIHQYINQVDIKQASNLLLKFSKLIRRILQHSTREEITLNEEIEQIELYISIEEIRFSNQFSSQINVDSTIEKEEILVPTMILQPFIENAIVHGLSTLKDREGILRIDIKTVDEKFLEAIIEDNGKGIFNSEKQDKTHESLSMKLIEERLNILNSNQFTQIKIENANPGTRITVKIPYQSIF